jgi:hypothetical protein
MTDIVPASEIEKIVGMQRCEKAHVGRKVSRERKFYILHSKQCLDREKDLRNCDFSKALDAGLPLEYWLLFADVPIILAISKDGTIVPSEHK